MSETKSQTAAIVKYLQSGQRLTPIDSLRLFGSFRLSGRIYDARAQGHNVKSQIIETESGKRVAEYWIDPAEPFIPREKKKKIKNISFDRLRELAKHEARDLNEQLLFSRLIIVAESAAR